MNDFTKNVINIIKSIPQGKVMTYGQVAKVAGNPWGARQVSRILHSMSRSYDLPWHRVVNAKGKISLEGEAKFIQASLLVDEGIEFSNDIINLDIFGHYW
jgi:methylated-DNA-protein-cysteine methyltransferase related protein